jgi:hypothetical protein
VVAAEKIEAMRKIWAIYMIVFSWEKKRVCFHEAVGKTKKLGAEAKYFKGNPGVCPLSSLHIQELAKVFIWLLRHFGTLSGTSEETSQHEGALLV